MMKKAIKKVQDTGAVKVIPPYPRWVKICFALMWGLFVSITGLFVSILVMATLDILAGIRISNALIFPLLGLFALLTLIVSGYGVYRAFRYFPKRAISGFALLVIGLGALLFLPAVFRQRCLYVFLASRSIIIHVLIGLFVGQGFIALFWKKARNLRCFISYVVLYMIIIIIGQVHDYVTRDYTNRNLIYDHIDKYCLLDFGSLHGYRGCPPDKPFEVTQSTGDGFGELPSDGYDHCISCYEIHDLDLDERTASMPEICPNRIRRKVIRNGCYIMKSILK